MTTRDEALRARIASVLDGDDNSSGHILLSDDPGDGSGPQFCACDRWNESSPGSWGQHVADEVIKGTGESRE